RALASISDQTTVKNLQLASIGESQRAGRYLSLKPRSATTQEHTRSLEFAASSLSDRAFPVSFPEAV
ncbi:hypothetical protein A2U01_0066691, partial [Trifolium medium]|nr:hypothetical protein [Trifolium medium]